MFEQLICTAWQKHRKAPALARGWLCLRSRWELCSPRNEESKAAATTAKAGISAPGRKNSIPLERQESPLHKLQPRHSQRPEPRFILTHISGNKRNFSKNPWSHEQKLLGEFHYIPYCTNFVCVTSPEHSKMRKTTSEAGKCHLSCPAWLQVRFHEQESGSQHCNVKIKLHTKSQPMTLYRSGHNKTGTKSCSITFVLFWTSTKILLLGPATDSAHEGPAAARGAMCLWTGHPCRTTGLGSSLSEEEHQMLPHGQDMLPSRKMAFLGWTAHQDWSKDLLLNIAQPAA